MKTNKTHFIITGALIAALYASLTYLGAFFGISYGSVQLRVSEVLTLLPIFNPAAIWGLTIGCFIANFGSFNALDLIFGTLATFIAAVLTYHFRNIKWRGLPILSMLMPVIFNALIIGFEVWAFLLPKGSTLWALLFSVFEIGISEFIVCVGFGIPFYLMVKKSIFK